MVSVNNMTVLKGPTMEDQYTTLISLSILKTDMDESVRDYLDYLRSFVLHVLNEHSADLVTDEVVSSLLLQEFGLNIPRRGCQLVLRRLARKGFLKRE